MTSGDARYAGVRALVPVRSGGKSRLAGVLDPIDRDRLVQLMLENVIRALKESGVIASACVLCDDARFVPVGCEWTGDSGFGLNAALKAAVQRIVRRECTDRLLIVAADLPFVSAEDVRQLVAGDSDAVVIASDAAGTGTNAMLLAPPDVIGPQFGVGSCGVHLAAALRAGVHGTARVLEGFAYDIDEPRDLSRLLALGGERYAFLRQALARASLEQVSVITCND